MSPRRQFRLEPEDERLLDEQGIVWETLVEDAHWLLLHGLSDAPVTAAVRIDAGKRRPLPTERPYFHPAPSRPGRARRIDGKRFGPRPQRSTST